MKGIGCRLLACIRAMGHFINQRPMLVGFLVMITIMVVGFYFLTVIIGAQSSFGFSQEFYIADNPELCAGDTLLVSTSGTRSGGRTINDVYESLRSMNIDPPYRDDSVRHLAVSSAEMALEFEFTYRYQVPEDAPPADYRLVYGIVQNGASEVDGFDVNFTVLDCS